MKRKTKADTELVNEEGYLKLTSYHWVKIIYLEELIISNYLLLWIIWL